MYPYNKLRNHGPSYHYTEKDFCKFDCIIDRFLCSSHVLTNSEFCFDEIKTIDKILCSSHVFTNSGFLRILCPDRFFWQKSPIKQQQSLRLIVKIRNSFFVKIINMICMSNSVGLHIFYPLWICRVFKLAYFWCSQSDKKKAIIRIKNKQDMWNLFWFVKKIVKIQIRNW